MPVDPKLLRDASRLLNKARLIAEASAARGADVRAAAKQAKPGDAHARTRATPHGSSSFPPGLTFTALGNLRASEISTLELYGRAINRAIANDSNSDLAFAIDWCEKDLKSLTHSSAHEGETVVARNKRIVDEYEGSTAVWVSRQERMSVTMVRKIRIELGREPRLGRKP